MAVSDGKEKAVRRHGGAVCLRRSISHTNLVVHENSRLVCIIPKSSVDI
jgi:hypothetical protein